MAIGGSQLTVQFMHLNAHHECTGEIENRSRIRNGVV